MEFTIIAAYTGESRIIGVENAGVENAGVLKLPWIKNTEDLKHFREVTTGGVLIVGRKTYETLPPLKGRSLLVLSSKTLKTDRPGANAGTNVWSFKTFEEALSFASIMDKPIFVIGGGKVYEEAIKSKWCSHLILTEIIMDQKELQGTPSAWFPEIPKNYHLYFRHVKGHPERPNLIFLSYHNLYNPRSQENAYLNSLDKIIREGCQKDDRTGVGTLSMFGEILKFDFESLDDEFYTFPLLTTKRMFLRGIVEELLFFLRGGVDNDLLKEKNVHIWDGNTTREFLDSRGLSHFEEGSLGKAYGFQWRFWGAEWRGKKADYATGKHHDQIANIIDLLKNDPFSRRIVLSAWNVSDLDEMCLPPCHTMYIFNVQIVYGEKRLFCHLTQRSGDMFLGVPFNIASASLLTFIIGKCVGIKPGGLTMSIVDAHIYLNHLEQVNSQISRVPYYFPRLRINKEISCVEDIEKLSYEDFELKDYMYHPRIKADMAL